VSTNILNPEPCNGQKQPEGSEKGTNLHEFAWSLAFRLDVVHLREVAVNLLHEIIENSDGSAVGDA